MVRLQRYIALLSVVLFAGKIWAWYLTGSVTVFTDALESIVNVIAGFIGLYSVYLSSQPRDLNHPYGHGKAEFVSAAVEGALIFAAGLIIVYEAVGKLMSPTHVTNIDIGIYIIAATGVVNYIIGSYAVKSGVKNRSLAVEAAGKHLQTDAYSTLGIVIGLVLLKLTGWLWLDSAIALVFAVFIIVTGYKIVRLSLAGIMDEADEERLGQVISFLQNNRHTQWIDLHNLRMVQYGNVLHIDAHMTLPWYYSVKQAEVEIHALEDLIRDQFDNTVEMFVHIDACMPYSCKLCALMDCDVRQEPYKGQLEWTVDNVRIDKKHGKDS
jgi:cation diffusion facilitator family transporter